MKKYTQEYRENKSSKDVETIHFDTLKELMEIIYPDGDVDLSSNTREENLISDYLFYLQDASSVCTDDYTMDMITSIKSFDEYKVDYAYYEEYSDGGCNYTLYDNGVIEIDRRQFNIIKNY
jgi:hypothetical protein